ncbi:Helicase required for RNAi-mediated heterochromatin assembly 1 [Talaromyces islandicus]|uniref:Helicase required for RNAi-mediated heterochromatin assembly 1 n=1 Tax=Talaromyces islandicus TaxID=28573 RepID=A0A0U1M6K3_TALIS|nr:Helicase required for RNAi-mediated heterochromatin assembly 1 [Talaromyces islandicus]
MRTDHFVAKVAQDDSEAAVGEAMGVEAEAGNSNFHATSSRNADVQISHSGFQTPVTQEVVQRPIVPEQPVDFPGELSRFGPRHDNDHAVISNIQILPTISEVFSDERPDFLPTRAHRHHQSGIRRLLDSQFRLLREDTCGLLRDSVRLILAYWRIFAHNPDWVLKRRILREKSPTPIRIFSNAKIQRLKSDEIKGIEIHVEFDQVDRLRCMSPSHRGQWWRDSGALKERGQIVALLDGEQEEKNVKLIFLLVTKRQIRESDGKNKRTTTDLARVSDVNSDADRSSVTLRLAKPGCQSDIVSLVSLTKTGSASSQSVILLEFPAVVHNSFEGILRCLQAIHRNPTNMPFSNWLSSPDEAREIPNNLTATGEIANDQVVVRPPKYLKEQMTLDLSFLPRPTTNSNTITSSLTMSLLEDPAVISQTLSQATTLDSGQATALVSALRKEVALIQGPPGTGKSYVGIQIARCLLENRELLHIGPIVCVGQLIELSAQIEDICDMLKSCNGQTVAKYLKRRFPIHSQFLVDNLQEQEYEKRMNDWISGDAPGDWHDNGIERTIAQLVEANVWTLKNAERVRLYELWKDNAYFELSCDLANLLQQHVSAKQQYTNIFAETDTELLNEAQVVGVTTTGLANNSDIIRGLKAKVLICEEAGEVLESHIITALLPSIEHLIMIGDQMQLRPRISNRRLSTECEKRGPTYNLDQSLFERLASIKFRAIAAKSKGGRLSSDLQFPISQLTHQRRMDPSISELIRETIYPNLLDHSITKCYPAVSGIKRRLYWLDHRNFEDAIDSGEPMQSKTNTREAHMVTALVKHLYRQGIYNSGQIAVLTPYVGQLKKLKSMLENEISLIIAQKDFESLEESEYTGLSTRIETGYRGQLSVCFLVDTHVKACAGSVEQYLGQTAKATIVAAPANVENHSKRARIHATNYVIQGLSVHLARNLASYAVSTADVQSSAKILVHLVQSRVDGHACIVVRAICHVRSPATLSLAVFDARKDSSLVDTSARESVGSYALTPSTVNEIDPDKDPLIFLSCGHFYTLTSLDGNMQMSSYYIMDESTGNVVRPKLTPWVITSHDSFKGCPECRAPLHNIDRYNRIVKRNLLNEATKRFVTQAHETHMRLLKTLENFEKSIDLGRENFLPALSKERNKARSFIDMENSLEDYQSRGMKLDTEINDFTKSVAAAEQPFGRVKELLASAMAEQNMKRKKCSSFRVDESFIQTGFQLYGQSMSLRLNWAVLWDFHLISNNNSIDPRISHALRQVISVRTNSLLKKCKSLLRSSQVAKFRVEEVRARVFHVQFSTLSLITRQEQKLPMNLVVEESTREASRKTLDESETLCTEYPGTLGFLTDEIEKTRQLLDGASLYSFVTTEETREVYKAMAEQFSGTGHWYYCENNHPFTIGECGMPMEQAQCPQCGAPVGGQDHELVEGVCRAQDMDDYFAQ